MTKVLTRKCLSLLYRAAAGYRRLPRDLVALPRGTGGRDQAFKGRLRKWVVQNVA